jgi:hypothetical protein
MIAARFRNGRLSLAVPSRGEFGDCICEHMLTYDEFLDIQQSIDSALAEYLVYKLSDGDADAA